MHFFGPQRPYLNDLCGLCGENGFATLMHPGRYKPHLALDHFPSSNV